MRVRVVFSRLMMPVVETGGRELFKPDLEVGNESILPVIDVNARRDVHRRDENHAFADAALLDDGRHLIGDADKFLPLLRVEPQVVGENHISR